jgi:hypothetical protein
VSAADCVICRGPAGDVELDRDFHVNLAPRRAGDALLAEPVLVDPGVPKPGRHEHEAVAARLRRSAAERF